MASNDVKNPALATAEGKQLLDQVGDELGLNIEKSEPSTSQSPCQNNRIQILDGHEVTTDEHFCGSWPFVKRPCGALYRRRGLLLGIVSAFCFSIKALFLEVLTKTVNPFQVVLMIMPILILFPLVYLIYKRIPLPKIYTLYSWLLVSGVSLSSYLSLLTLSIYKMEVADAITVAYTCLVFVGLLSWIILKETPTVYYAIFSFLSFLGVVFIARPPFLFGSEMNSSEVGDLLIGTGFGLGAAFSVAVVLNAVRKQTKLGIHTVVSMLCNAVIVVLMNFVICTATRSWRVPCSIEWLYAIGAGLSYFFAQLTLYMALKFETSTFVNIVLTSEILFAFLWQFAFLRIHSIWTSYLGAIFVIVACIGMTLKEKPQNTANGPIDES